jgi:hypothetical protein
MQAMVKDKITFYISPVLCCPHTLQFWGKNNKKCLGHHNHAGVYKVHFTPAKEVLI